MDYGPEPSQITNPNPNPSNCKPLLEPDPEHQPMTDLEPKPVSCNRKSEFTLKNNNHGLDFL